MQDAVVEIVAYDAEWPQRFQAERDALVRLLGRWLVGAPEHIGSTSVPGLAAKPVIDIMAPVASLAASRDAVPCAAELGYCHYPYQARSMHWFCKPSPARRTHHLHLVPLGSRLWQERLAFREALRSSAELRAEYEALKRELAARFRTDRDAYTEAKTPFVRRVLDAARRTGPHRPAAPRLGRRGTLPSPRDLP